MRHQLGSRAQLSTEGHERLATGRVYQAPTETGVLGPPVLHPSAFILPEDLRKSSNRLHRAGRQSDVSQTSCPRTPPSPPPRLDALWPSGQIRRCSRPVICLGYVRATVAQWISQSFRCCFSSPVRSMGDNVRMNAAQWIDQSFFEVQEYASITCQGEYVVYKVQ